MDPSVSSAPLTSEELEGKKNVFRDLIAKIDEQRDRVLAQRNETFVTMDA